MPTLASLVYPLVLNSDTSMWTAPPLVPLLPSAADMDAKVAAKEASDKRVINIVKRRRIGFM